MLENLKILLGINEADNSLDAKLELIISMTTKRLQLLLGGIEPPEEMEHIILEVHSYLIEKKRQEAQS